MPLTSVTRFGPAVFCLFKDQVEPAIVNTTYCYRSQMTYLASKDWYHARPTLTCVMCCSQIRIQKERKQSLAEKVVKKRKIALFLYQKNDEMRKKQSGMDSIWVATHTLFLRTHSHPRLLMCRHGPAHDDILPLDKRPSDQGVRRGCIPETQSVCHR